MKCVHLCGPQAVGKMTVGEELTQITELKLFHNHMTIEPLFARLGLHGPCSQGLASDWVCALTDS